MDLSRIVSSFLRERGGATAPLLLAFSGGVDSLALFYALLECRKKGWIRFFGAAHIDHGWRESSAIEAQQLGKLAARHTIPYHCKTLRCAELSGNLEERCRYERLLFFKELCKVYGYHAVLLAHHADDQAETVLKRLFEGASLSSLKGMAATSEWEGVVLWRPLLRLPKKKIAHWCSERGADPIDDATNRDTRYLRARMRAKLLPHLNSLFGKEIAGPLVEIGRDAAAIESLLEWSCAAMLSSFEIGWAGALFHLPLSPPPTLALQFVLRRLLISGCGTPFSREQIEQATVALLSKAINKRFSARQGHLYIDRGYAFALPSIPDNLLPWKIQFSPSRCQKPQIGWQNAWAGTLSLPITAGNYRLGLAPPTAIHTATGRSLGEIWTAAKVPRLLYNLAPVVWQGDEVAYELLSGSLPPSRTAEWQLSLTAPK